ncbi:hypothetical protein SDC9_170964 [bioreactor metagenome]|uniref:Uncharacterized protein n=1 Tax=bioreactor metagenome TaxID=1076179 RepID=A0A645GC62_9ZZZZ
MERNEHLQERQPADLGVPAGARERELPHQQEEIEETEQMPQRAFHRMEPEGIDHRPGDVEPVYLLRCGNAERREIDFLPEEQPTPAVEQDQHHHEHHDDRALRAHYGHKLRQRIIE